MEPSEKKSLPHLSYNWISLAGSLVALATLLIILFLLALNLVSPIIHPYLGVFLYMVLPVFLVGGLLLIPLGMYIKWRMGMKAGVFDYRKWPSIDLNDRRHLAGAVIFVTGTGIFLLVSGVGIYEAYHYTDSVSFCGLLCHKVMKPEYTAFQSSPHARLQCVDCHIGPGAGWYARSKLSGMYQVYVTLANKYPRPVPTPIEDLRPVQAECEQCHWPRYFFGAMQRRFFHYMYDEDNTPWPVDLLLRVGGGQTTALTEGIHWHMNIGYRMEYKARDKKRQDLPWVRMTEKSTGAVMVYEDVSNPMTKEELDKAELRVVDCIDCHTRPAHRYNSPDHEVDMAIQAGAIDRSLPQIKRACVEAMEKEYATEDEAVQGIADYIEGFYRTNYPGFYSKNRDAVSRAIPPVQEAFKRSIFPEMKVRWTVYPYNIGHFMFPGCMRCHDGNHKAKDGTLIKNDCYTCHIILGQGEKSGKGIDLKKGVKFRHPVNIGDAWKDGRCFKCHGGVMP